MSGQGNRRALYADLSRHLSRIGATEYVASNPAAWLSLDLLPGVSCRGRCTYCYAQRGQQAMARARELQAARTERYRSDPAGYADVLAMLLQDLSARYGIPFGTAEAPLKLFGSGDGISPRHLNHFARELGMAGVAFFGFSRLLGLLPDARHLVYSADRDTPARAIQRAQEEGRRIAYVRQEGDPAPSWVTIVFPEHRARRRIPKDRRDCYKLRHAHGIGVCHCCGRCL